MNSISLFLIILLIHPGFDLFSQGKKISPDLLKINDSKIWTLYNRELIPDEVVHLNAAQGDGLLWNKELEFSNGIIELDIKGKNIRGKSFVGIAFHGLNDSTYDVIYFRPFNFMDNQRKSHSVQYISHPKYTWYLLREKHPEKYENQVSPIPDPTDWFHATIVVDYPKIKVFVNNNKEASLNIDQLSSRKKGWVGFWVGNGSDGYFKNLKIKKD